MSRLPAVFLLLTAKSALTHWMETAVLKTDIPWVIDVNNNKHVGKLKAD